MSDKKSHARINLILHKCTLVLYKCAPFPYQPTSCLRMQMVATRNNKLARPFHSSDFVFVCFTLVNHLDYCLEANAVSVMFTKAKPRNAVQSCLLSHVLLSWHADLHSILFCRHRHRGPHRTRPCFPFPHSHFKQSEPTALLKCAKDIFLYRCSTNSRSRTAIWICLSSGTAADNGASCPAETLSLRTMTVPSRTTATSYMSPSFTRTTTAGCVLLPIFSRKRSSGRSKAMSPILYTVACAE